MAAKAALASTILIAIGAMVSCSQPRTITGKPLLACDQSKVDAARLFHGNGLTSLAKRDFGSANRSAKLGLARIGNDYDPYTEALDDSGLHLAYAEQEEREGHLDVAARERLSMLEDRTSSYAMAHRCRR